MLKKIKKLLPSLQENVSLKNYTTFKIGGKAKYFFAAKTKEDLVKAISVAKNNNLPFFILGGGSNLLVADEGYDGLVIKCQMSNVKLFQIKSKCQMSKIYAETGVPLSRLINISLKKSLTGLEWAAGIPGITVGGAIRGNAEAFGTSISDIVKKVEVLDVKNSRFMIYDSRDCKFGYRDSIFKHNPNLIIFSAEIQLKKGSQKEIKKKIKKYLDWRKKNQPLNFPSAGSVFKNPKNFSVGYLIEKCGLKGKKIGAVEISEKHANFIVNLDKGKAKDVLKLINLVKKKVKEKFGIELDEEIQYLGF